MNAFHKHFTSSERASNHSMSQYTEIQPNMTVGKPW